MVGWGHGAIGWGLCAWVLWGAQGGCAHRASTGRSTEQEGSCPVGGEAQPARVARLRATLQRHVPSMDWPRSVRVCFIAGQGRGVISGRTLWLDGQRDDAELSAQAVHLLMHLRDDLGDGCGAGLDAARASEARAYGAEMALRAALRRTGLRDGERDEEGRGAVPIDEGAAATARMAREADSAQRDYVSRCRQ